MQNVLQLALARSFLPLVRFALARGLKIQDLTEVLKSAIISCAQDELIIKKEKPNISRLAVITGLHRRDVIRLTNSEYQIQAETTLLTKVVGLWATAKRYKDKKGHVRPISYAGTNNDFVKLCESVSKDLNPYTVLFELERLEIVHKNETELVLKQKALLPDPASKEALELLADDIKDLCDCVTENSESKRQEANLHVKTYFDNIPPSKITALREWVLTEGSKFHDKVRAHLAKYDRDTSGNNDTEEGSSRIAVGSFSTVSVDENNEK